MSKKKTRFFRKRKWQNLITGKLLEECEAE